MKRTKWTPEEDAVLLKNIKQYPQNLKEAFKKTSEEINRTVNACNFRWYAVLSRNPDKSNTCFILTSPTKISRNKKICKDMSSKSTMSKWKKILNILFSK